MTASPIHKRAFRHFVWMALNTDELGQQVDPLDFTGRTIQWSERDNPRLGNRYALLRELAFTTPQEASRSRVAIGGQTLNVYSQPSEWTTSIMVVVKQGERAKSHAGSAEELLRRAWARFWTSHTDGCQAVGLGPMRSGTVQRLPGLVRDSQWETRAQLDLTWSCRPLVLEDAGAITSVGVTGTIDPLGETFIDATPEES